jgi:hypothetical protein
VSDAGGPALSVVMPCDDSFETIRDVMRHYAAQPGLGRAELVLVSPAPEALRIDEEAVRGFGSVQVVRSPPLVPTIWQARAEGVRAARAPVVLFAETHAYPRPGTIEALIAAHEGPWAGVGMSMGNANPGMVSWSNVLMDYGPWINRTEEGDVAALPSSNASYKRDALLALGGDLGSVLEFSFGLSERLRARGERLSFAAGARALHLNVTGTPSWLRERVAGGRGFAGMRARGWSTPRRLAYALASPLIPAVRLRRILREIRRAGLSGDLLPGILPALLASLVASAAGEAIGYLVGVGESRRVVTAMEVHKSRHTRPGEVPVPLARHEA